MTHKLSREKEERKDMKIHPKFLLLSLFITSVLSLCHSVTSAQLVPDFRVNEELHNTSNMIAEIALNYNMNFTVVWGQRNISKNNIFAQRFDNRANFLGFNFRINTNPDSSSLPSICYAPNGNFAICWLEINSTIINSSKQKLRFFSPSGNPLTNEIVVNDSAGSFIERASIACTYKNELLFVWEQNGIRFQVFDSAGKKLGLNSKVNDYAGFSGTGHPSLAVRKNGSFIITWEDTRPPASGNSNDIYLQIYDSLKNKVGVNRRVNDDTLLFNFQISAKVASDDSGNFVITWNDDRLYSSGSEIFAQLYNKQGNRIGNNFRVSQNSVDYTKGNCDVFMKPSGEFLVGWSEFRPFIRSPYFQRFNSQGMRIGNNYRVTQQFPGSEQSYDDFVIAEDRIISVWSDERNGLPEIFCNVRSFTNPDTTVEVVHLSAVVPESFALGQNYPNPFNSSTVIEFEIRETDMYSLELSNLLGQYVQTIFKKRLLPGKYQISVEPANLCSGTYCYSLSSGEERVSKRFVILK